MAPQRMLGLAVAAACARGAAAGAGKEPACPTDLEPYLAEASPFGWPVAPAEWQFSRPECWAQKYPLCAGDRQSPMNLDFTLTNAECKAKDFGDDGAFASKADYTTVSKLTVSVSKYLRSASVSGPFGNLTFKDSAGLDVDYEATSAHLTAPSLHAFNGKRSAAELMIVHKPKGQADALGGAVVVSVLFEAGEASAAFAQLGFPADGSDAVHKDRSEWKVAKFDLGAATGAALQSRAFSYEGSVPVPPCTENVHWIVLGRPQTAAPEQVAALKEQLEKHTGGLVQRPLARRDPAEICREVSANSMAAPVAQTTDCSHSADRTAACWTEQCDKSPIDVHDFQALAPYRRVPDLVHYSAAEGVTVAPSAMSLDAKGHFGRLVMGGRSFEATKVSVKAISSHTVHGVRHAGEVLVEHTLFGDDLAMVAGDGSAGHGGTGHDGAGHHRRLEGHGDHDAHDAHDAHTASGAGLHKVIVSIPLKLGRESPLLRSLGLGVEAHREAIRHGNSYPLRMPVDLGAELKNLAAWPNWYWYSGGPVTPGTCPAWGVKWMVFEDAMEVSLDQLNYLALQVSGVDATPLPKHASGSVYLESFPDDGVAMGSCDNRDQLLNDPSCWSSTVPTCAGMAQSPIDISSAVAAQAVGQNSFLRKCSWKPVAGLRMENNGHCLHFQSNQLGYTTTLGESGFPKYYQVTGVDLKMPSEHTIDGKHFAAELQIVQKNQKTVLEYDDDDMIISSILFNIGEESKLLKQMMGNGIPAEGQYATLEQPLDLQWALGPVLDGSYYRYEGSLTTPRCSEVVQWTIFETPLTLSMEQFQAFKKAFPNPGNNRPLQELNGRTVLQNTMEEADPIDYNFFLNREMGRNKRETNPALIAFPIIATLLLCSVSMFSIFQREDKARKLESAGGLQATTVGRGYDQM